MTTRLIFDSHALLRFFQQERGSATVERWLRTAKRSNWIKYLCAINLGEIIYVTKRRFGDQRKIELLAHIHRLNFTILPVPNELIYEAAEYKAEYSISYADCFVLTCAVKHAATIVTGDSEFKKVSHLAKIHWI
ncbi:MAG: type II toxin-antitoxin system VapC family toxin [Nitrospira sp.]|nr:type II toxin-antitoxin system VapC family toxin [Nitrospira sp.]